MRGVLTKIQPLNVELIPPSGAVPAGVSPSGKQLWKMRRKMARPVPRLNEDGSRMMRKHQITGEPLYGLNKPEIYEEDLLFYLENDGQGNLYMIDYRPPTPEQLEAEARDARIAAMQDELAAVLVDEGMSPAELIRAIRGGSAAVGAPEKVVRSRKPQTDGGATDEGGEQEAGEDAAPSAGPAAAESFVEFPIIKGPGVWQLCDGSLFGGAKDKKKREEAEAANAEARERLNAEAQAQAAQDQAAVPEV